MTNIIFYSLLFILSLFLSLITLFLKENLTCLFAAHAICQLWIGTAILIFFDTLLYRKKLHFLWISFCFFLFLGELAHLTLARLLDSGFDYLFRFLFGGGLSNFLLAWSALNLNISMVITIGISLAFLPVCAIFFYRFISIPIRIKPSFLLVSCASFLAIELALPSLSHPSLPWGSTLLPKSNPIVHLPSPFKPARNESVIHEEIQFKRFSARHLPNIYIFIIESLRRDFIHAKSAPIIHAFSQNYIYPTHTYSNANSTFPSWFSILHANFPHHWTEMRDTWNQGSAPLHILKNLGYELCVYSSADLKYFGLDSLLFGKNRFLTNYIHEARHSDVWAKDASCIDHFAKMVRPSGQINLFFLDSTHSEYSFPPNFPLTFEPICSRINYLTLDPTNTLPIQNRYLNAIHYIDHLFDKFLNILKEQHLLDDALIVLTGDHGEEFFEEGSLFHGTHLNTPQTNVPIIYKVPKIGSISSVSTHIDILPTILHAILKRDDFKDLFDGESIFSKNRRPYRMAIHHNCAMKPNEFWIESKENSCRFRLKTDLEIEVLSGEFLNFDSTRAP